MSLKKQQNFAPRNVNQDAEITSGLPAILNSSKMKKGEVKLRLEVSSIFYFMFIHSCWECTEIHVAPWE